MSGFALVLYSGYLVLAFGVRSWVQRRATGDAGFRGVSGRVGSWEWWGGVSFVLALVAGLAAPVAAMRGVGQLDLPVAVGWAGAVLSIVGTWAALASQVAMGGSWRIGVDAGERTALVGTGPFALVRNPFFTATVLVGTGLALMIPNVVSLVGVGVLVLAVQLQVRVVEEPHLLKAHPDDFLDYAARVGRFVPWLGRLAGRPVLGAEPRDVLEDCA